MLTRDEKDGDGFLIGATELPSGRYFQTADLDVAVAAHEAKTAGGQLAITYEPAGDRPKIVEVKAVSEEPKY